MRNWVKPTVTVCWNASHRNVECCLTALRMSSVFFHLEQLESLGQSELASRLTLNCQNSYVEPHKIKDIAVTIMDVSLADQSRYVSQKLILSNMQ